MSGDLFFLEGTEPYDVGRAGVNGFIDEPDHTMVPRGDYDFDPEGRVIPGAYLLEGIVFRCWGREALRAQWN